MSASGTDLIEEPLVIAKVRRASLMVNRTHWVAASRYLHVAGGRAYFFSLQVFPGLCFSELTSAPVAASLMLIGQLRSAMSWRIS